MNKVFFLVLVTTCYFLTSCGNPTNSGSSVSIPKVIDYRILEDEAALRKIYEEARKKMGDGIQFVEKLNISVDRPGERGRSGDDDLQIILQHIHPTNRNKLREVSLWASEGKWSSAQTLEIDLIGGDAESFRLEDYLMDLSGLTFERLFKIVQEACQKYKSDKYSYQYVSIILIKDDKITVFLHGKLAANELLNFESYEVKL